MLTLARKNTVLLLILVSLAIIIVASISMMHATNPTFLHHFLSDGPDIVSHY